MAFLHGVRVQTNEIVPRSIRDIPTAVVGLVGTAPMFEVAAGDRSVNIPQLVLGPSQAARLFGSNKQGYTIPRALDAIFAQGAGRVVCINVLDPAIKTTIVPQPAIAAPNFTFDFTSGIKLQASGVRQYGVSAVTVSASGAATNYVEGTDFTVDSNQGIINRVIGGAIAPLSSIRVGYTYVDPSKVTIAEIIGTTDGTGNRTGMKAWADSYNLFGFKPKMLIAPGYSPLNSVSVEMISQAAALKALAVLDAPIGTTHAQAIAARGTSGGLNFNTSSSRAMLLYPYLKSYDSAIDAETLEPYSQRWAGVRCRVDDDFGFWWSASNKEIYGVTGVERRLTAGIDNENSEVNLLNEVGIISIFNTFGTGIRSWGNRSAAWPTNTSPINFEAVQRTKDVIEERITEAMLQFIDFPLGQGVLDAIAETVNADFRTLQSWGAVIDGECTYDKSKNDPAQLALGKVVFDLRFMPPPPLELIEFQSTLDISLLKQIGIRINEVAA